jgi:FAD/FMN-containing dehydrogenase
MNDWTVDSTPESNMRTLTILLLAFVGMSNARMMPDKLSSCLSSAGIEHIGASDSRIKSAAELWNKLNTTIPAAIAYPTTYDQVSKSVLCAKSAGVKAVPKSGGHSYMGYSMMPDDLTIDLTRMNTTTVSSDMKTATVQAGSHLGMMYYHVYDQTHGAKGAVAGTCPPVGIAGFMHGGGIGMLTRQHGLGCDQVIAVKMVLANGQLIVADETVNADILHALCGVGGGNLGVVVEYTLKIHDVPSKFTIAQYDIGSAQALKYMKFIQHDWIHRGNGKIGMSIDAGTDGVSANVQYPGPKEELARVLSEEGLLGKNTPWKAVATYEEMDWVHTIMYQSGFGDIVKKPVDMLNIAAMEKKYRTYFKLKSFFVEKELTDDIWNQIFIWEKKINPYGGYVLMDLFGGESSTVSKIAPNATGFVHRNALFGIQYGAEWEDGKQSAKIIKMIDDFQKIIDPFFAPDHPAYVNYYDIAVSANPLKSYYGNNLGWLQSIKTKLDPNDLFTANPLAIPALK